MVRAPFGSGILILLLWLAGLGAAAQFAKFAVPFAALREAYSAAGAEVGWLLTTISAIGAVFGMTAGVLVARVGLARAVIGALILGGVLSLWQATVPSLSMMLASRLIEGVSHLMLVVATPTLIAQIASDRYRGVSMTLWSTFFGVSFALMAWLGLPLVASSGLGALLIAHGVFMLAIAGVLATVMGWPAPSTPTVSASIASVLRQHVEAYRSPNLAAPAVGWLFYTMTFVALLAVLPDLLPPDDRAAVATLMPLVSIAVALVAVSALLSVFSAVAITVFGFLASALVVLLFFASVPLAAVSIGVFAVLGLVQGASFAAVPELNTTNETRALANGALAQAGNIGNLVGTPLLLATLGVGGHGGMLLAVATLYLAGGAAHILMARARARAETADHSVEDL